MGTITFLGHHITCVLYFSAFYEMIYYYLTQIFLIDLNNNWLLSQVKQTMFSRGLTLNKTINQYLGKMIQLETLKGYFGYLRSSFSSQNSFQNDVTTVVNHHLPTKILLGTPIVGYTQSSTQINLGFRPNDPYVILDCTTTLINIIFLFSF